MPKPAHFGNHFLPIMDMSIKPKLAETALLVSGSTPRIHSEARKDQVLSATCTLAATCCGGHPTTFTVCKNTVSNEKLVV